VSRHLVQDKETQLIYAVETNAQQDIVRASAPIPFHEVGRVLPARYEMREEGAADLNRRPMRKLGPHDVQALNTAYADRRTMPVTDGTPQDSTQPEAIPESVPTPNPPELGKPLGVAVHDQADDIAAERDPAKTDEMTADEAAAQGASTRGSEAIRAQTERNEGLGDSAPEGDDPEVAARVAARAGRSNTGVIPGEGEDGGEGVNETANEGGGEIENENEIEDENEIDLNHHTEVGTAGDARDSEQYAPREGANMKPGADLRRASQLPGQQPNPQDDQDGRKTQDAANGGKAARAAAIEAGEGQQEKQTAKADGENENENESEDKADGENESESKAKPKGTAKRKR
jgi:hypothetical protein